MEKETISSLEKELKDKANEIVEQIANDQNILTLRDIGRDNETTMKKVLKDLSKAPAPKQLAVGAGAGWMVGYLTMKVGKAAATAVGGSLLILQIAHHKGYIKVDWNRMTSDTTTLADRVKDKLKLKSKSGFDKFMDYAKDNIYVAGGFTAGFFLGIASS